MEREKGGGERGAEIRPKRARERHRGKNGLCGGGNRGGQRWKMNRAKDTPRERGTNRDTQRDVGTHTHRALQGSQGRFQ